MHSWDFLIYVLALAILTQVSIYSLSGNQQDEKEKMLGDISGPEILEQTSKEFDEKYGDPKVIEVIDGVYVAIGYAMGNTIILVGSEGVVIVDTTESRHAAHLIHQAIKNITELPIKAIVYTHHHADHTIGATTYINEVDYDIPIIAHESFMKQRSIQIVAGRRNNLGSYKQFGALVPEHVKRNGGMGKMLIWPKMDVGRLPTDLIQGRLEERNIAGLRLQFHHLPGETDDQLLVWLPDTGVLCAGDNIYQNFPNLYTIRGSTLRDPVVWANSLDAMRALRPKHLVMSHTEPVSGEEEIEELLTVYRDGMMYIHDQTIRLLNLGHHPVDVSRMVKLPDHLVSHPFMKPLYGNIAWVARSVYTQYNGWFSGDIIELNALSPNDRHKRMVKWLGTRAILDKAMDALAEEDFEWALELSTAVFVTRENNKEALDIRTQALKGLAGQQTSINDRNFYLSWLIRDNKLGKDEDAVQPRSFIKTGPIHELMSFFKYLVKSDDPKIAKLHMKVVFSFTDLAYNICFELRNGVLNQELDCVLPEDFDVLVEVESGVWRDIMAQDRSAIGAYMSGALKITGGLWNFKTFIDCIQTF